MDNSDDKPSAHRSAPSGEPVIYVVPEAVQASASERVNLLELWHILLGGKWLIAIGTTIFAVGSIALALTATEWYRAEVLLAPADQKSAAGLAGQLGGLANLVGISGISVGRPGNAEAIAVLTSRSFTRSFIEDYGLLLKLFEDDWDAENARWKAADPEEQPDIRDAIKRFDEEIRRVSDDKRTGLVTLSIEWTDPDVAAEWANSLATRLNANMRQRALTEAERNIAFLEEELADTSVATLRPSIGRLLETELQKLMLARGNEEFAFRVIDPAAPPKYRSRPKRTIFVMLATAIGGFLAVCIVLGRHALRQNIARTNTP